MGWEIFWWADGCVGRCKSEVSGDRAERGAGARCWGEVQASGGRHGRFVRGVWRWLGLVGFVAAQISQQGGRRAAMVGVRGAGPGGTD